jgi:ubiquinone/menaquinone biosynthesis C-methylase UbiE
MSAVRWMFELGADFYGWLTAQDTWRRNFIELGRYLPQGDRLRLIDLGCGPGVSTFELARLRPGAEVVGFDLAWRMLTEAQSRTHRSGIAPGRITWIRGDAGALPFGTASVDALTGHSFLYLLPDRAAAMREALRVLRPGGKLLLMEPNSEKADPREILKISRDPRFLISMTLWRPVSRFKGRFTASSLEALLRSVGFAKVEISPALGGLGLFACAEKA